MTNPEPRSRADLAHLWLEYCRRQLGRARLSDDDYERLGHEAVAQIDHQPTLDLDDPEF